MINDKEEKKKDERMKRRQEGWRMLKEMMEAACKSDDSFVSLMSKKDKEIERLSKALDEQEDMLNRVNGK